MEVLRQVWPRQQAGSTRKGPTPPHGKRLGAGGREQRTRTQASPPLSLHFWVLVHTHALCVCIVWCVWRVSLVVSVPVRSPGLETQGPPLTVGSGLVLNFSFLLCDDSCRPDLWAAVIWGHSVNPWPRACPGAGWVHVPSAGSEPGFSHKPLPNGCSQTGRIYDSQGSRENRVGWCGEVSEYPAPNSGH